MKFKYNIIQTITINKKDYPLKNNTKIVVKINNYLQKHQQKLDK